MLDAITLDQLRALATIADEGSFSAAARKLRRVQSAISHSIASLEEELGVVLFDRSARLPKLTEQGRVVLAQARRVLADADELRRLAQGLVGGLEPAVGLVVDAIFPLDALVDLCREFAASHPSVGLKIHTETLAAVSELVIDGTCQLGVVGPDAPTPGLERRHLTTVRMIAVVAAEHPLARYPGRIPASAIDEHVQIVMSERAGPTVPDRGVLSSSTWRVADLHTKHRLLRAGLGWGRLPEHVVREELAKGVLVRIRPEAWGDHDVELALSVVHRRDAPIGPASRWLIGRMGELCSRELESAPPRPAETKSAKRASPKRARSRE